MLPSNEIPASGGEVQAAPAVTLVGVRHRDPASARRLESILFRTRPARVLVEVSPASLAYRRGPGREWRRSLQTLLRTEDPATPRACEARELISILAIPAELRVASRYARETTLEGGAHPRVVLAERSRFALPYLDELDAWAQECIDRLRRGVDPIPFAGRREEPAISPDEGDELEEREQLAARAVRRAVRAAGGAPVVHVGGYAHLPRLATLLGDLRPLVRCVARGPLDPVEA